MTEVTDLLQAIERGNKHASADLLPIVYDELRRLAKSRLENEKPGQTLQATALVHEAYLRLVGKDDSSQWNSRGHFYGAAAEAMRRILIENARRKTAEKRGGSGKAIEINSELVGKENHHQRVLELKDIIQKLEARDKEKAELVKLKLFAGLSTEDAAQAMDVSIPTAFRWWKYCRAWLKVELG